MIPPFCVLVKYQIMVDRVSVSLHHHSICSADDVSFHGTQHTNVGRGPVKAKPVFGTIMNPVLLQHNVHLTLYHDLYSSTVVLQHSPALSADIV